MNGPYRNNVKPAMSPRLRGHWKTRLRRRAVRWFFCRWRWVRCSKCNKFIMRKRFFYFYICRECIS